jgi:citrate lyase synthetase
MFRELFFYPVAQTDQVLLMEDRPDGIGTFLRSLPAPEIQGVVGAAVMNCNPFTLGHRYLIETAASIPSHIKQMTGTIGIAAGASTPGYIIDEVEARLRSW